MSHRSRKHRKRFVCGHRGFGQYCHRCADRLRQKQAQLLAQRQKQQHRKALFDSDPIDLKKLPHKVVKKARQVLSSLNDGLPYWQVAGKRLNSARNIVKIPITRRYRLICRDDGDQFTPLEVLSHEDYNPISRNPKRVLARWFSRGSADR